MVAFYTAHKERDVQLEFIFLLTQRQNAYTSTSEALVAYKCIPLPMCLFCNHAASYVAEDDNVQALVARSESQRGPFPGMRWC